MVKTKKEAYEMGLICSANRKDNIETCISLRVE